MSISPLSTRTSPFNFRVPVRNKDFHWSAPPPPLLLNCPNSRMASASMCPLTGCHDGFLLLACSWLLFSPLPFRTFRTFPAGFPFPHESSVDGECHPQTSGIEEGLLSCLSQVIHQHDIELGAECEGSDEHLWHWSFCSWSKLLSLVCAWFNPVPAYLAYYLYIGPSERLGTRDGCLGGSMLIYVVTLLSTNTLPK